MSEKLELQLSQINEATEVIANKLPQADVAIILGSGLGSFAKSLTDKQVLAYQDIPHFPLPSVFGHSGEMIYGKVNDKSVLVLSGRFHYYEGHEPETVILPIRVLHQLGYQSLILTNAAGGINPEFAAGDLMLINDHINFTGYNPLRGENSDILGPRFPDMSAVYDKEYLQIAKAVAGELKINLQTGVYCGLSGPSFETPAEIKMLGLLGADAVGMSTVPEAIAAAHMSMRLLGISCISNLAAGINPNKLSHDEVTQTGKVVEEKFASLIKNVISRL